MQNNDPAANFSANIDPAYTPRVYNATISLINKNFKKYLIIKIENFIISFTNNSFLVSLIYIYSYFPFKSIKEILLFIFQSWEVI